MPEWAVWIAVLSLAVSANGLLFGIWTRMGHLHGIVEGVRHRLNALEEWARDVGGGFGP